MKRCEVSSLIRLSVASCHSVVDFHWDISKIIELEDNLSHKVK